VRLQLSRRGDYAVRAMIGLADAGGAQVTGRELAASTGVPAAFLPQVMGDLVRAGLVTTRQGRSGGYRLARDPGTISLLTVVEAVEGDSRRTTCVLRGGPCGADGFCRIHHAFFAAQEALLSTLSQRTLADLDPP
jgi:Rrf2 family transcriptional regulator, iron-sulfur cluster assembly transcription factor